MKLNTKFDMRVNKEALRNFRLASLHTHGREPCALLREIMVAIAEGRITIKPTEEQVIEFKKQNNLLKQSKELYHVD